MPYQVVATSKTPALIIYLLDMSGSMKAMLDGKPKIELVNEAVETIIVQMVERSTKGAIMAPRYRIALAAYSDTPNDIYKGVVTIDQAVQAGLPKLAASNLTNTAGAFAWAKDLLRHELQAVANDATVRPAPMVCHLTDGLYTGDDPEPLAREIMALETKDGNVLVENIFVGNDLTLSPILDVESWGGIKSEAELSDDYAKKLFRMSSPMPESYVGIIMDEGYSMAAGSKMLIPAANKDLIRLAFAMSGATKIEED